MLTLSPPTPAIHHATRSLLEKRWMPGDWFELTPGVVSHYAWKAAVAQAAFRAAYRADPFRVVEIGTRAGYSLAVFFAAIHAVEGRMDATCIDGGIDNDSFACLKHWRDYVTGNSLPARLIVANSRGLQSFTPAPHFAHVDGDHSAAGAYHDLLLVADAPVILADDCDNQSVKSAVMRFVGERQDRSVQFVNDGLRVLGVISQR